MIYLFFTLAVFLLIAAAFKWQDKRERWMSVWFLFWAVVNAGCGINMLVKNDPHAFRLHDRSEYADEPDQGMPDRR